MAKGPFIVVDALDAGGSQTQADRLAARLRRQKFNVLELHFPQEERATGRMVYDKFLLEKNKRPFSRREQALLYIQDFFSRKEDIEQQVSGGGRYAVVSDRYCMSTFAYQTIGLQGAARERMYEWIDWLCFKGTPRLPKPDLVIFIDTPVAISLERLRNKKKDYFENRQKLTAIRNSYLRVAARQRWIMVAGADEQEKQRTRDDIEEEIWQKIKLLLGL